uniref:Uncharacterized protein n=2 Tax=Eptatretus burgeri TaxID=7764 RepID=A0A8C4N2Q4_EPTBU
MPRHVLHGHRCVSCDDDCTGVLLNDLDTALGMVATVNLTGKIPAPYAFLSTTENTTHALKHHLSPQRNPNRLMDLAKDNLQNLVGELDELLNRVKFPSSSLQPHHSLLQTQCLCLHTILHPNHTIHHHHIAHHHKHKLSSFQVNYLAIIGLLVDNELFH